MRYLGLDLGSRTLGVSLSDNTKTIASSLKTIRHNEEYENLVNEVLKLIEEQNIEKIILGYPKNMNNTIGLKAELSEKFKKMIEEKTTIPVILEDERLTTKSALDMLISSDVSRKKRKKVVDSIAATIILQQYLDKEKRKWIQ